MLMNIIVAGRLGRSDGERQLGSIAFFQSKTRPHECQSVRVACAAEPQKRRMSLVVEALLPLILPGGGLHHQHV